MNQFRLQYLNENFISIQTHQSAVSKLRLQHIFQRKRHDVVKVLYLKHVREQKEKKISEEWKNLS